MSYDKVYFIGIGGIGMSALARYFKFKGFEVSGYDRTPSELTEKLIEEGIAVHYEDRPDLVPEDKAHTLVVYTPAIPADLGELVKVTNGGYNVVKRSRALGEITRGQQCLAVSGTHGKTTTSTLIAHIFTDSGEGCSAFLGGISRNYGTNMLMSHSEVAVAEADEFDRSFLQLFPTIAVITSVDPDHLDIYGTYEKVTEAFRAFASQVSGTLIAKLGIPVKKEHTPAKYYTYHLDNSEADFYASGITVTETGNYVFDLVTPWGILPEVKVGTPGRVNAENTVAAAAVALTWGIKGEAVKKAVASFQGVKRRLEAHVLRPDICYIDDYAHHPAELAAAIASIRDMFPERKLTAIFQPHLYTRTRDFADEFAESLSAVDRLILLDIYPAREEPIPGVTSEIIFSKVTAAEKILIRKEELMDLLERERPEGVLVTFGAGNIDRFIEPITKLLEAR